MGSYLVCEYHGYTIFVVGDWSVHVERMDGRPIKHYFHIELAKFNIQRGLWRLPTIDKLKELYPTIYYIVKD
jgi:hypothetical protein